MTQQDETPMLPFLLTIPQVAETLNLGKSKVYELIDKEHLPVQRFGRAVRVSREELITWLQTRKAQQE